MPPSAQRQTRQKEAIGQVLERAERPLDIEEILRRGRQRVPSLNLATVYRNLNRLVEDGRLRRLEHPGQGVYFERADAAHHHHFHCRRCAGLFCLPGCPLEGTHPAAPRGFITEEHQLILYGLCRDCAEQQG